MKRYKNAAKKKHYNSALKIACEFGMLDKVTSLLNNPAHKDKIDVNHISAENETALDIINRSVIDLDKKTQIIAELKQHGAKTFEDMKSTEFLSQISANITTIAMATVSNSKPKPEPLLISTYPSSSSALILEKLSAVQNHKEINYSWQVEQIHYPKDPDNAACKFDYAISFGITPKTFKHESYLSIALGTRGFVDFDSFFITILFDKGLRTHAWQQKLMAKGFMAQIIEYPEDSEKKAHLTKLSIFVKVTKDFKTVLEIIDKVQKSEFPKDFIDYGTDQINNHILPFTQLDNKNPFYNDLLILQNKVFGLNAQLRHSEANLLNTELVRLRI
jgi:hypothetical protein